MNIIIVKENTIRYIFKDAIIDGDIITTEDGASLSFTDPTEASVYIVQNIDNFVEGSIIPPSFDGQLLEIKNKKQQTLEKIESAQSMDDIKDILK